MIDADQITNWFTYHAPTRDQQVNYETIRNHAREFAHILNNLVPDGADKLEAMDLLRKTVMTANAAIATAPASATAPTPLVRGTLVRGRAVNKSPRDAVSPVSPYQTVNTGRKATGAVRGPNGRFIPKNARTVTQPQPVTMKDLVAQLRDEHGI